MYCDGYIHGAYPRSWNDTSPAHARASITRCRDFIGFVPHLHIGISITCLSLASQPIVGSRGQSCLTRDCHQLSESDCTAVLAATIYSSKCNLEHRRKRSSTTRPQGHIAALRLCPSVFSFSTQNRARCTMAAVEGQNLVVH